MKSIPSSPIKIPVATAQINHTILSSTRQQINIGETVKQYVPSSSTLVRSITLVGSVKKDQINNTMNPNANE